MINKLNIKGEDLVQDKQKFTSWNKRTEEDEKMFKIDSKKSETIINID